MTRYYFNYFILMNNKRNTEKDYSHWPVPHRTAMQVSTGAQGTAPSPAVLAGLPAHLPDDALPLVGAGEGFVGVVLHGPPEEGLAGVAAQPPEVVALGHVPAHPAQLGLAPPRAAGTERAMA